MTMTTNEEKHRLQSAELTLVDLEKRLAAIEGLNLCVSAKLELIVNAVHSRMTQIEHQVENLEQEIRQP